MGKIARNRSRTGIIAEGRPDNNHLWVKIRDLDENTVHHSVDGSSILHEYGATAIGFEHLGKFRPFRRRYGCRTNEKRAYWLCGRIFEYARYEACEEGIVTWTGTVYTDTPVLITWAVP